MGRKEAAGFQKSIRRGLADTRKATAKGKIEAVTARATAQKTACGEELAWTRKVCERAEKMAGKSKGRASAEAPF